MKKVIAEVVDDGDFFEVLPLWAMNIVCGFARIDGHVVGDRREPAAGARRDASTSTRPRRRHASCAPATRSTSRSSRSSTYPGSCPAPTRSTAGSSATARSCSTRTARRPCRGCRSSRARAYGGAYVVMNSKSIGADLAFAWPSAEIAVMGAARARSTSSSAGRSRRPPTPRIAGPSSSRSTPSGSRTRTTRRSAATSTTSSTRATRGAVLVRVARDAAHQARAAAATQARERPPVSGATSSQGPVLRVDVAGRDARGGGRHRRRDRGVRSTPASSPARRAPSRSPVGARVAPRRPSGRAAARPLAPVGSHRATQPRLSGSRGGRDGHARARGAVHRRARRGRRHVRDRRPAVAVTTRVGAHEVTTTGPYHFARVDGLEPATEYTLEVEGAAPAEFLPTVLRRWPARPDACSRPSRRRTTCTSARPSAAGSGTPEASVGPILRAEPGDPPYPEVMNHAAIDEIARARPRRRRREGRSHRRRDRRGVRGVPRGVRRLRRRACTTCAATTTR